MGPLSSRRYVKRVWRVPKDRGPAVYLAALIVKALVKHGWPAKVIMAADTYFQIEHVDRGLDAPGDFWDAVEIATRIVARTYGVEVQQARGYVELQKQYRVAPGGHFREIR